MVGVLFAIACWAIWFLSPHNVALLVFDKEAILAGEWWRLWTAQMTHFKSSQLILNSFIIALTGLVVGRFVKAHHLILSLMLAMPVMTGLLLMLLPDYVDYRGAFGVAAVMAMLAIWFLILETERFSQSYWFGVVLLLLFVLKVGIETLVLFSPSGSRSSEIPSVWLIQSAGILIGLVVFYAAHQIHASRTGRYDRYHDTPPRPRPRLP